MSPKTVQRFWDNDMHYIKDFSFMAAPPCAALAAVIDSAKLPPVPGLACLCSSISIMPALRCLQQQARSPPRASNWT
ncbi:hypothetical protein EHI48_14165 [Rhizobium sp. WSM1325]|nr:hypothetical protein EHI46_08555 [Rhizobium leguminosarum]RWY78274.1 hypothetical protein EHI48_14165 [Rhizobium leguminosarum]